MTNGQGIAPRGLAGGRVVACLAGFLLSGCAAGGKEIRHHPKQTRLERILASVLPHTKYPDRQYWVRVAESAEHPVGLAVMQQRHIYLSESLIEQADDAVLTALVVHGVAHHRLHHLTKRSVLNTTQ